MCVYTGGTLRKPVTWENFLTENTQETSTKKGVVCQHEYRIYRGKASMWRKKKKRIFREYLYSLEVFNLEIFKFQILYLHPCTHEELSEQTCSH